MPNEFSVKLAISNHFTNILNSNSSPLMFLSKLRGFLVVSENLLEMELKADEIDNLRF